jgi:asparagine synthase (glutamine-hydrolysing)
MTFMVDNNLTKVDRASMAHSLEVRVPFLDHRIAEFAFSLPDDLCIREGRKKYLLRRFLERKGLRHLLDLPKQGFSFPWGKFWPVTTMAAELRAGVLVREGIIARNEMQRVITGTDFNRDLKLWQLAVLEKWARRWLL